MMQTKHYALLQELDGSKTYVFEIKKATVTVSTRTQLSSAITVAFTTQPAFDFVMTAIRNGANHLKEGDNDDVDFKRLLYEANNAISAILSRFGVSDDVKYLEMQDSDKNGRKDPSFM